ncbi:MAG: alpha/beta hydrolase [Candidatus Hodarchaeales archaeon]|jgi:pimeloyl-ACP methyl ester carboxylesterase
MKTSWYKLIIESISPEPFELKVLEPEDNSKGIVLHFHGFPGGPVNESYFTDEFFVDLSYTFVTYNYPGLWQSPGFFSIENLFTSTLKIVDEIINKINNSDEKIILFSESFGAAVGIHLIDQNPTVVKKMILRSPFLDFDPLLPYMPLSFKELENFGVLRLSDEGFSFDSLPQYNPKHLIKNISDIDVWGVIGKNDSVLPSEFMLKAAEQNPSINLELWDDFPHNDISLVLWKKYFSSVEEFLTK